jgi:RNA polymerase sigma-70 factor (ECF subfamily)
VTEPSLEHLFLRFRDHGDVRAMASVYDRVATELLLVATHFGAKAGDAEDLLQATFLAAMESAGTFDRGRPLMPWLVGILIHQARRERRSRARRLDAQRLGPQAEPPDPLQLAEDAEFAEEFARKLSALPVGYRQVLTLRWVHGLSPTAVAHSLGLSPETV